MRRVARGCFNWLSPQSVCEEWLLAAPLVAVWLLAACLGMSVVAMPGMMARAADPISHGQLREASERALRLIERSADEYLQQRECFSCHHQAMATLTTMEARQRGLAIDHENLARQVNRTIEHLRRGEEQYKQGQGQGGKVDTAGYALLGLAAAGWPRDHTTDAVTEYLLKAHVDDDRWICSGNRPPTEANDITTSALALRGLQRYARPEDAERVKQRIERCQEWLSEHPPEDNEQRVFRLLAEQVLGNSSRVTLMRDAILAAQRDDGGWSQTATMESDAYATGTSLYALAQSGYEVAKLPYQRGLRYLLDTQLPDGSWHVTTRSRPIQKYFESGYPHGADQFISIAASSWSTLAMLLAQPRDEAYVATLPKLPWSAESKPDSNKPRPDSAVMAGKSLAGQASASEATAAELEFFERDIRPLLVEKCAGCHGAKKQSADLRVDSMSALLSGGESGPALIPRSAERSLIMRAVRREGELQMPPDDPLSEEEISKLGHWIDQGAHWPKGASPADGARSSAKESHWAFQPLARPTVPDVRNSIWANTAIDRFVLAKLEEYELSPAPTAARRELLRRVSYDLTGLPPSAQEQDSFAEDDNPDAYQRVVDRLLASPRFGEQWGRHWLDVARYSDTKGYVYAREERFFVHAPAYRDWVINAFAEDLPFDRFVLYQLAADQVVPEDINAQAAMGFLTVGRRFLGVTHDIIDDRIDVVTRGLLGLTVACARCHDHKFDPIPTADYYSLYGVFHNSIEQRVRLTSPSNTSAATGREAAPSEAEKSAAEAFEAELAKRQQQYRERMAAERQVAIQRVHERITDYLLAQLELEKYPAEGFDIIIGKDDLVPAHVRRFEAYLLEAAERDDPIFSAWRAYQQLSNSKPASAASASTASVSTASASTASASGESIADEFASAAAAAVTAQLARLPSDRLNRLVLREFSTPPTSMRNVAERYGTLFLKLAHQEQEKEKEQEQEQEKEFEPLDAADRLALAELVDFWEGPQSPCAVPDEEIVSVEQFFDSKTCEALWKLQGEVDRWINQSNIAPAYATVLRDRQQIREPHIFRRGNPRLVGERVTRQFLTALSSLHSEPTSGDTSVRPFSLKPFVRGSGRRELAEAIVDPRNPLTTRVWTNRLWQHVFGQGLVRTPSDFGVRSDQPSHPELLDWMTNDYIAFDQSTKRLIRQLVLSSAYQQAATVLPDSAVQRSAADVDPDNKLLWRSTPKRLSFEQQRDTWLMIAGQLDSARGGRAQPLFGESDNRRRTIYGLIDRQFLPGVLRVFDFANPDLHTPQRSQTTVPQQALFELNHEFVASVASGAARATIGLEPKNTSDQQEVNEPTIENRIDHMFRLVLGRRPGDTEMAEARQFIEQPTETVAEVRSESLAWHYGFAKFDPAASSVQGFTRLPHFTATAWQGGPKWPDSKLGWVQLTAQGGHAGNDLDHAAVKRWTAPRDGTLRIASQAQHDVEAGDGIRCSIVARGSQLLGSSVVHNRSADLNVENVQVKAGDTIDFVVDFHANLNSDQFRWSTELTLSSESETQTAVAATDSGVWNAERDFSGPKPKLLDPWEQLAQVLLLSNELMFVD